MSELKNFYTIIYKELVELYSSKSWILIILLPLFIAFIFNVIYNETKQPQLKIGYLKNLKPEMQLVLKNAPLKRVPYQRLSTAKRALLQKKIDGVIYNSQAENQFTLLVDKADLKAATLLADNLNVALLQTYATKKVPFLQLEYLHQELPVRWASFPIWLLQIILTICLLQTAAAIADEKERQTLHALLVTPLSHLSYLLAKLVWVLLISNAAIFLAIYLTKAPLNLGQIALYSSLGAFLYTSLALMIGLFTPNALFARTLATFLYLVSALPLMVRELDFAGKNLLKIFPSYLIVRHLETTLLPRPITPEVFREMGLLLVGSIGIMATNYFILKNKTDF